MALCYITAPGGRILRANQSGSMVVAAELEREKVEAWLDGVVVGLQLCPFAARPREQGTVRIVVSEHREVEPLLQQLYAELMKLDDTPVDALETTLLVVPHQLADFDEYWTVLGVAEELLAQSPWRGGFQIASFHPDYQFDGCEADDPANFSNRSPYPIFHLLRESSVSWAVDKHPDVEAIPERNIDLLRGMDTATLEALFPGRRPS